MDAIDALPCIIDDGDVRRPYPGESTQFYGAYLKDAEGLSEHVVDFYCMDLGYGYYNDRYMVVFRLESDGPYPSVCMTAFGMFTEKGEMQKSDLDVALEGRSKSFATAYHIVPYESLPEPVQRQIQHECRQYAHQPVTA